MERPFFALVMGPPPARMWCASFLKMTKRQLLRLTKVFVALYLHGKHYCTAKANSHNVSFQPSWISLAVVAVDVNKPLVQFECRIGGHIVYFYDDSPGEDGGAPPYLSRGLERSDAFSNSTVFLLLFKIGCPTEGRVLRNSRS
jgi:hypothetical protein